MAYPDSSYLTLRLFHHVILVTLAVVTILMLPTRAYALINPVSTTVVSSTNPSAYGESVTFTATVTGVVVTPSGTVTFKDGTTTIGTGVLNASGQASISTTTLSTGSHSITVEYSGDLVYNASTSAVLTQNVVANSTSTSLVSSANPSALNQSVIFTATVTSSGGTPTGTVTFMDSGTTLGTGTLDASGQTTFATSVLLPGNHSITAVYSGDSNFSAGSSPVLTQTVNLGTSSTALISSANPSTYGQSVTFTATVSGLVIQPTGTVTFKDGATTLGTGNINASGQATFTTSTLSAGSHSITAVYGGDSLYNSSTSNLVTQTVNQSSSTTILTSSINPSALGASVTFTATVSGSGVTPTGTVTFKDGATTLGTGTVDGSGVATYSTSALTAGSHSITAVYGGDTNYATSTSSVLTQNVVSDTSSTAIASSANPSTYGTSVTFTATVTSSGGTPTGTVTFKDSSTTLGIGTLNGSGIATYSTSSLTAGSHSITAVYGGDSTFASSTSSVLTQTVNQATSTTTVASSANPSAYHTAVTFTATVSSSAGTPTGTVTFKDGATTLGTGTLNGSGQATLSTSSLSAGSHSITVVYAGDTNFATSTSPTLTQTVNQGGATVTVASSANPSAYGQSVTFTATVGGSGITPTGTVTFKDGATTLGTGTLNGSGQATYTTSSLSTGSHSITAVYGGDSNYSSNTSSVLTQSVGQTASTVALTSSANPSKFGQSVTFTATVTGTGGTPTGTVTFKDGATTLGTGTLDGSGQATFTTSSLSGGSHSITAVYGGDSNFASGTSPTLTQSVGQGAATVALASSPNPSTFGQTVTFTATVTGSGATPTGTVTFQDSGTTLGTATLSSGIASFATSSLTTGKHSITAIYNGDSSYHIAVSKALTQIVNVPADSVKLRKLQVGVTKIAAQVSGQAISGAIDSAISDSFSDNCRMLSRDQIGLRISTCPERTANNRVRDAFAAFAASPRRDWMAWADIRGTGWDTDPSKGDLTGRQINGLAGVTFRISPRFIAGALGGYESFNYSSESLDGQMHGDGWTVGGYLGWKFVPGIRLDAGLAYSAVNFNGIAGTATGAFLGNRILGKVGLTGTYQFSRSWSLEPSARVYALTERDGSYVDSLGTVQAKRSFMTGRASVGGKVSYLWQSQAGMRVSPYLGLYTDYYFSKDNDEGTLVASAPTIDGASARLSAGTALETGNGSNFSLGGEVGGLGSSSFRTWTIRARSSVRF